MLIKQMSVFVENTTGRLAQLTRVLGNDGIDIKASCIADTVDFGILRCIVDDPEEATRVLKEHGFTASITEVIAVELEDRPGGFADVLEILAKEKYWRKLYLFYNPFQRRRGDYCSESGRSAESD